MRRPLGGVDSCLPAGSGRQAAGWVAVLCLTFSYTAVGALVPAEVSQRPLVVTAVWAAAVSAGYTFRLRRCGRSFTAVWSLPRAWWSVLLTVVTAAAVGTTVALAPSGRSHVDLIRITILGVMGEEVLFRGLIWDLVHNFARCGSGLPDRPALVVTSILFAVSHAQYVGFRPSSALAVQVGYTLVAGLTLGWVRARTGSLAPGALLHAMGNALLKLSALV